MLDFKSTTNFGGDCNKDASAVTDMTSLYDLNNSMIMMLIMQNFTGFYEERKLSAYF